MSHFIVRNADHALYVLACMLNGASEQAPRGFKVKEQLNCSVDITCPARCIFTNPARKLKMKYTAAELLWYLSGDLTAESIGQFAKMWLNIADDSGLINSNYGYIIFFQKLENCCGSQFNWVIESLIKDKSSRQALINFNQPKHKYAENKDFPCTIAVQFFIRDDVLHMTVYMRSQDLIRGFCYDVIFFSFLQQLMLAKLQETYPNLILGSYVNYMSNIHVYEPHYAMLDEIIRSYNATVISDRLQYVNIQILDDIKNKTQLSDFSKYYTIIRDAAK